MVPRRACIQAVLKVKVKGHVIRTLLTTWKSLLLSQTWLDRHQTCTRWSPRLACIQDMLKVKVKGHVIRTLVISRKSLILVGKWLDRDQTCIWWSPDWPASRICSRSRSRSNVTWYGHLWFHENRFFYHKHDWIATRLAQWWSPRRPASRVCSRSRSKVTW